MNTVRKRTLSVSACLLAGIGLFGCTGYRHKVESNPADFGFSVLGPIADADPSRRVPRDFDVPGRLRIERAPERISIKVDQDSLERPTLKVGENMVTGFNSTIRVLRDGEPILSDFRGITSGTRANLGTSIINRSLDNIPQPSEKYLVEMDVEIFETDIPPQHIWAPNGSDKYRVLWTRTLRQNVE